MTVTGELNNLEKVQARLVRKVQKEAAEFPAMDSNHYADILGRSIDSLTMALNLDRIDKHSGIA